MKIFNILILFFIISQSFAQVVWVDPIKDPGSCNRNANDPLVPSFRDDIKRGVFKYTVDIGTKTYSCTGTLINRNTSENDLGQYFVTSWHCFIDGGNQFDFNNVAVTFYFNYQSPPDHLGKVFDHNVNGSEYSITRNVRLVDKVSLAYGDFAICEILGAPIPPHYNPYYVGWMPNGPVPVSSFITFGHAQGSLKQVAASNLIQDGLTGNIQTKSCKTITKVIDFLFGWIWKRRWSTQVICEYVQVPFVDSRYIVPGYIYGTTKHGQSGSGIFGGTNRLFGTLTYGVFGCSATNDFYSRFPSFYFRQAIKNTLNPPNKWMVDELGIPGRNRDCYSSIEYNYNTTSGQAPFILYPAKYYQSNNSIVLNSSSYVRLGINPMNSVTVISGGDFTFNAGSFIDLGPYFDVQTGATFTANSGVSCNYSGTYRVAEETDYYEDLAKGELYASINSIHIPDRMELPSSLLKTQLNVQVYPNPASEAIHLSLLSVPNSQLAVTVYDIIGRLVYTQTFQYSGEKELEIPSDALSNGVYQIECISGNNKQVQKLIIQK